MMKQNGLGILKGRLVNGYSRKISPSKSFGGEAQTGE